MFIRTYVRTLFNDIFKNNFFVKALSKIVNFCFGLGYNRPNKIKFPANMPINVFREKKVISFQSVTGDKLDCK